MRTSDSFRDMRTPSWPREAPSLHSFLSLSVCVCGGRFRRVRREASLDVVKKFERGVVALFLYGKQTDGCERFNLSTSVGVSEVEGRRVPCDHVFILLRGKDVPYISQLYRGVEGGSSDGACFGEACAECGAERRVE